MKDDTSRPTSTHLGSVAERIDGICDDFECRWRNGESPQIEWYLNRIDPSHQSRLLSELLGIELFWRRRRSEDPRQDAYLRRFPGQEESVLREFKLKSDVVLAEAGQSPASASRAGDTSAAPRTVSHNRRSEPKPIPSRQAVEFPSNFGEYELLGEIGHGGMGVVYRARQRAANRIVALKVISHDRLGRLPEHTQTNAVNRFRDEAQAAAHLQHENLVTVFDVGEVDGQPYFSMQLVEGKNIAETIREAPLEPRTAARYLRDVACAVAEAHAHKILHRDLKPHNILIDAKTDRPKVADFGLAKFQARQDAATSVGQVLGTPQYMAPEQARDSSRAEPASDIYSLGATLYHMLTGRPPFQASTSIETLRQVLDDLPAAPRDLNQAIPRDLETICLKCLEKEPARRYLSAQSLADDLSRFLAGETILARPVGPAARLVRWCRRNQAVAGLSAFAAVSFLALLLVLVEANRRDRASLAQVVEAKNESEVSFQQAREAVDHLFTQVSDNALLNQPGLQPLRKELLQEALAYYQLFVERGGAPLVNDELALLHFRIGRITADVESPQASLAWYERALKLQRSLVAAGEKSIARREALGDTINFYGQSLAKVERLDDAESAFSESLQIRTQLAQDLAADPETRRKLANIHMNLGQALMQQGEYAGAQEEFHVAQLMRARVLDEQPHNLAAKTDRAMGYFNSANLAIAMADPEVAQTDLDKAIAIFRELVEAVPERLDNQYRLAICFRVSADLAAAGPRATDAIALYAQSQSLLQVLEKLNPHVAEYRAALAGVHLSQGVMYRYRGEFPTADRELREAASIYRALAEQNRDVPGYRRDLAAALLAQGAVLAATDARQTAREAFLAAQQIAAVLADQFPQHREYASLRDQADAELAALGAAPATQTPPFSGPPEP